MNLLLLLWFEARQWARRRRCARHGHDAPSELTFPPLCPRCLGWVE